MYVKSESGRGPVWLRELRILCKLCKLWTERRSSRSSRVDLNALITRSCKNREGRSIRKRGGKPATHKHAVYSYFVLFFRAEVCYGVSPFYLYWVSPWVSAYSGLVVVLVAVVVFFYDYTDAFLFLFFFTIANVYLSFFFLSVTWVPSPVDLVAFHPNSWAKRRGQTELNGRNIAVILSGPVIPSRFRCTTE